MKFNLEPYHRNVPDNELIDDLIRVANSIGSNTVRWRDYATHGRFSHRTFKRRFGSWKAALDLAGLKRARGWKTPNEELFANLEELWLKLGRQPHVSDLKTPLSRFSPNAYLSRFGRWRVALQEFVSWAEAQEDYKQEDYNSQSIDFEGGNTTKRTPRQISDRLRAKVLLRDGATCRLCGARPEDGAKLHVDHIKPWSKGGETLMENLQILCDKCNVGKSNLEESGGL